MLAAAICCYLACAMHNIKNIRTNTPHFSRLFHIISCCYLLLPFFAAICCYVLPSAAVCQNQRNPTKSQPQPHLPQPATTNRNQLKPTETTQNHWSPPKPAKTCYLLIRPVIQQRPQQNMRKKLNHRTQNSCANQLQIKVQISCKSLQIRIMFFNPFRCADLR